jgi:hypothetical protein
MRNQRLSIAGILVVGIGVLMIGLSYPAAPTVAAQRGPCYPNGDPLDGSKYKGHNAFYLCKEGTPYRTAWGNTVDLEIACRENSLRAGWKWKITCDDKGEKCACNRDDYLRNPRDTTAAAWSAGDHCTVNGQARPGQNGCGSW